MIHQKGNNREENVTFLLPKKERNKESPRIRHLKHIENHIENRLKIHVEE